MKCVVLLFVAAVPLVRSAPAPLNIAFNPDTLMYNDGMVGGDIAGGVKEVFNPVSVSSPITTYT